MASASLTDLMPLPLEPSLTSGVLLNPRIREILVSISPLQMLFPLARLIWSLSRLLRSGISWAAYGKRGAITTVVNQERRKRKGRRCLE